jgi:putative transposase
MSTIRDSPAVAAVYDRREEDAPALIETPLQDKPVRCSGGLRPPEENELGAHRDAATGQPLQKPRLHRLDWVFADHPIYFVTACTFDRKSFLACAEVHEAFQAFCFVSPNHGVWVGRYVLMPDHLHLFVSVDEISLSDWVKSLKNSLSKTLRTLGCDAPHWQKGFFDHLLRSGESYSQKWGYVRENPVRAGLVAIPEDWSYAGEIHDLEYRK